MKNRGMGTVYQRGQSWVIDYYINGDRVRETVTDAKNESQARAKLKERISQIHTNTFIRHEDKLRFEDLVKLIEAEYELKQRSSKPTMQRHVTHLRAFFKHYRAIDIQPDVVQRYQLERKGRRAAPATINREIACLHHMLVLAVNLNKLSRCPKFEKLEGEVIREGFLGWSDFDKILAEINGQWRKNLVEFQFLTGWRSGKVKSLEWRQVFLNDQKPWIKADPGSATKKAGQDLALTGRLLEIVQEQAESRDMACPYVFHRNGSRIGGIRKSWANAVRNAGLGHVLLHDLRRSMARAFSQAGIPQQVIMARAGWRTASTFARYRIVDLQDQASANTLADQARAGAISNMEMIKK